MRDDWDDEGDDATGGWSESEDSTDENLAGDSDGESDVIECPKCGCDVFEDAEQCPVCGEWFVRDTSIWSDRPYWWVWLGLAGIVAVILTLLLW